MDKPLTCHDETVEMAKTAVLNLFEYCKLNDWAGYDPYDGLNSPFFRRLPFLNNRLARLAFTQFMKRSTINFRPLTGIQKEQNPKGLALFSSALVKLLNIGLLHDAGIVTGVIDRLVQKKTPDQSAFCWGYNFDWQQRNLLVPRYTPNIICTTFAGHALLDAFEKFGTPSYWEMALSAGRFIVRGLNISESDKGICFSYTSLDRSQIHNANFLGAAFLGRLYRLSNDKEFYEHALAAARFSVDRQMPDGSWPYGENELQKWIDNFHTGYNLVALHRLSRDLGTGEFEEHIVKGHAFYRRHFFTGTGMAKYYHDAVYPIDIHAIAQSIVTLMELKELDPHNREVALSVCKWGMDNMKGKDGYFYYQKKRFCRNKISYMRWSQAWMLYALSALLEDLFREANESVASLHALQY